MKDSLENKINFNKITFSSVERFLDEAKGYGDTDYKHAAKALGRTVPNLDSVSHFLESLGVIETKGKFVVEKDFSTSDPDILRERTFERLVQKLYPKNKDLSGLIDSIVYLDGQYWYIPNQIERVKFSGIRNLLHELNFLEYKSESDRYLITKLGEAILTTEKYQVVSPEELEKKLLRLKELGQEAEKVVLVYERNKLKDHPKLVEQIEHTAKKTTNAGYDIRSYSAASLEQMYIEVKAVSRNDKRFYWTKNEMLKAKTLGDQYFLYLVPAINSSFVIEEMMIIQNPYMNVYRNDTEWQSEIELISFSKAE